MLKSIVALLAIAAVVVIGVAAYSGDNNLNTYNPADVNNNISSSNNSTQKVLDQQNNSMKNMISAQEAQEIAETYIEEPGATAGTPNLVELNGQMIYVVPVIMDGKTVGQIEIDAYTGKNVGGAGGVA
ncbi:MAG: PepSY domain-containing protein [Methanobacterium sp.]|nr:PepSY domain-containing protein [Methanobacterium sp.]